MPQDDEGSELDRRRDPGPVSRRGLSRRIPAQYAPLVYGGWSAAWITAFALGHTEIGLPMMLLTGALSAVVGHDRRRDGRRDRRRYGGGWGPPPSRYQAPPTLPPPVAAPPEDTTPNPERQLTATVLCAETSGGRLDPDALQLVREVDRLLRPMLAQLRTGGSDPAVQHDVEAIASEHLPAALDAYLALPTDYAHEHRSATGTTPTDEFRSQLTLLVEGCKQLQDALRAADVSRQQELSRFLELKFRKSDLDL